MDLIVKLILAVMGAGVLMGALTVISAGWGGVLTFAAIVAGVAASWWLFDWLFRGARG